MKKILTLLSAAVLASCATGGSNVKPYTSDTCILTDNKLGSMGTPVTKVYGDQEVKFCCKPCVAKFEKDPQRYLKKFNKDPKKYHAMLAVGKSS
jgi:YHS domain-containing protein